MDTKVTYIFHSCFAVEDDYVVVVFDYWRDHPDGRLGRLLKGTNKPIYFVASHFHADHYSSRMFEYADREAGARFLLSYDVVRRKHVQQNRITDTLRPGHMYSDEYLTLHAFRSTDIGVSVALTLPGGATIFHAGDLNTWYFSDPNDKHLQTTLHQMEGMYMSVLDEIKLVYPRFDHVMFPVDPRLEDELLRGAFQWLRHIETANFYPMHFWRQYDVMAENVQQLTDLFPATCFHLPPDSEGPELPQV